jgi:beta-N-acetylglucosaminidase
MSFESMPKKNIKEKEEDIIMSPSEASIEYATKHTPGVANRVKDVTVVQEGAEAKRKRAEKIDAAKTDLKRFTINFGYSDELKNLLTSASNTPENVVSLANDILTKMENAKQSAEFLQISGKEAERFNHLMNLSLNEIDRVLTEKQVKADHGREYLDARMKKISPDRKKLAK